MTSRKRTSSTMPPSSADAPAIVRAAGPGPEPARQITIESKSSRLDLACGAGETLLQAGLRQGLALPYECATGTCGSCRARVMEGEVEIAWEDAPGAARLKREKGDILLCQTRAKGDLRLRVPAAVEAGPGRHPAPDHRSGVIGERRRLTADVMQFELALSAPMDFEAGQFAVITVPGLEGGRAYSMVNYRKAARRLEFVVKRKPGGGFGDWLFDGAGRPQTVEVFGPLGRATFHPEEEKNLLMVAGGSGIAGMMAILARASDEGYFRDRKAQLFFGVRTLADGFFLDRLEDHVDRAGGNLEVTLALSDEQPAYAAHPAHPRIRLAPGFVHEVMTQTMAGRYDNPIGYIAGPTPMVDGALRTMIAQGQMSPQTIRYDKFT